MKFFIKMGTPCELNFHDGSQWNSIDSFIEHDWMLEKENFEAMEWEDIVDDVAFGTKGESIFVSYEHTTYDFFITVPWEYIIKLV